jgi:hypothetical protein
MRLSAAPKGMAAAESARCRRAPKARVAGKRRPPETAARSATGRLAAAFGLRQWRTRAAGDAASRAVAVCAAKSIAEDIQAGLEYVIPEGFRLAQQHLDREEAGKRDYPWLADAHCTPALRSNSTLITRYRSVRASRVSRTRLRSARKSGSLIAVKSSLSFMTFPLR